LRDQGHRGILALPLHVLRGHCREDIVSTNVATTSMEVTVEDVQRILDLGHILRSVLTEEELIELEKRIKEIGNAGDS